MKFIHLADSHLASENKFSSEISNLIRTKSWETFENILEENTNVDFALIAGDLLERSFFTTKDYEKLFSLIKNFGKNVYYVTGNHDYISDDNKIFFMDKPSNLKIFNHTILEYLEEKKSRIYGMSYDDRIFSRSFNYNIELDPSFFNIFLVHGVVGEKKSNYLNLDLNRLKSMGFDYVALGHIHKPISISENILYSGTTEAKDFSENLDYGYILYDGNGPKRKEVSQIKFNEITVKSSNFLNQEDLFKFISERLKDKINFLRLNIKNDSKLDIDKEELKKSLNLFYLEIKEEKTYDYNELKSLYEDSLLDRFLENTKKLDQDQQINKRAKELGIDAILRSRYD